MDNNTSKRIWNKICFNMNNYKNSSEDKLQIIVETIFDMQLGWDQSLGCISRDPIHFGSASYGIPDLLLKKNNKRVICIELKKYTNGLKERNKEQLFSYMRQLKLSFGILWGNKIQLFYDELSDDNPPICVCEIPFNNDDELGVKLVGLLNYDDYDYDNFKKFCTDNIKINQNRIENNNKMNFLSSSKGVDYIKSLLLKEYSEDIVNNLDIIVKLKHNETNLIMHSQNYKNIDTTSIDLSSIDDELMRRENEKTQDWIKRILIYLDKNNLLTDDELENLQDFEYCKETFGIQYPLLIDDIKKGYDNTGRPRYWSKWLNSNDKYMGKYYVCSQWWRGLKDKYEFLINKWLKKIMNKK